MEYLGHKISVAGVLPLPSHVAAIQEFPRPSIIKELQAFLGMVNFYRRFLPSIARTLRLPAGRGRTGWSGRRPWMPPLQVPSNLSSQQHTWHIPQWGRSCQWLWTPRRHT